jgi:hypothetical protein
MIDFVIGFGIGYFLKALLTHKVQHDILLSWDSNSLGWRSVPPGSTLYPDKRYLAAIEIKVSDPDNADQI